MNNIVLLGIGNCGGQIASLAETKYSTIFKSVYINTSQSDLSMIRGEGYKFKIGEDDEIEGSGKNRTKMKDYLFAEITKLLKDETFGDAIFYSKYAFIISSAAGGTGSGAAPILLEILRQTFPDTNFILIAVLPSLQASLMEQGNTIEYLNELYKTLDESITYMIYDNETFVSKSPTEMLSTVNNEIVEDLRVLSGVDNFPTPYESIDDADLESIISTPGRLIISRVSKNINEKSMEDGDIGGMIIRNIKDSAHAETERNKKVVRWGVITYFTDPVNKLYSTELPKLIDFIGTPVERFNHNAINPKDDTLNFMYLIASGLTPINDRVAKITDRIDTLKESLGNDSSNKYILDSNDVDYDTLTLRRDEQRRKQQPASINIKEIFGKFDK